MIKLNKKLLLLLILILLPLVGSVLLVRKLPVKLWSVYPGNDSFRYNVYRDIDMDGNSIVSRPIVTDKGLRITYTIGDQGDEQYIGLFFKPKNNSLIDLSSFDNISLSINLLKGRTIYLIMLVEVPGVSNPASIDSYCPIEYEIPLWKQLEEYIITLDNYTIPDWWLKEMKVSRYSLENLDFSKVLSINLEQSSGDLSNIADVLLVKNITFHYKKRTRYFIMILILVLYYLVLSLSVVYYLRIKGARKRRAQEPIITYKNIKLADPNDRDLKKIITYLGEHYRDPMISVSVVSEETGISQAKIPRLIKEYYSMSFPRFVNTIRITEAKRLIKETDFSIIDIAMSIGYNNISHFNRTFKSFEKISPKEYRELEKNSD